MKNPVSYIYILTKKYLGSAVLEARFGEVPFETSDRVRNFIDLDVLRDLLKSVATVADIQEFDRVLEEAEAKVANIN